MFDLIAENFSSAILVLDHKYRVSYMNREAKKLVQGLALDEDLARLHPEWSAKIQRLEKFEMQLNDGGQVRFFQVIPAPIYLHGMLSMYTLQFFDITNFRLMEQKYLEVTNNLFQEHAEVLELQERLKAQVFRDPLTGIYNRRYLEEYVNSLIESGKSQNEPFTLAILDLDHFKQINDFYGHKVGDAAILNIVESIKMLVRKEDVLCRLGGDELVLVFPRIGMTSALRRMEDIRKFVFKSPIKVRDHNIFTTVSVGVSEFPTHGRSMDRILRLADKALYRAKLAGRNRIFSFDRKTDGDSSDRILIHKKSFVTGNS